MKLKKGDRVQVLSGKDKGRQGSVMRVFPKSGRVIVEGRRVTHRDEESLRAQQPGGDLSPYF